MSDLIRSLFNGLIEQLRPGDWRRFDLHAAHDAWGEAGYHEPHGIGTTLQPFRDRMERRGFEVTIDSAEMTLTVRRRTTLPAHIYTLHYFRGFNFTSRTTGEILMALPPTWIIMDQSIESFVYMWPPRRDWE